MSLLTQLLLCRRRNSSGDAMTHLHADNKFNLSVTRQKNGHSGMYLLAKTIFVSNFKGTDS